MIGIKCNFFKIDDPFPPSQSILVHVQICWELHESAFWDSPRIEAGYSAKKRRVTVTGVSECS